jgi:hypothetical protein
MDCRKLLKVIIALALTSQLAQAGVYQWRDEQGRLHFSDKPPASHDSTPLYSAAAIDNRAGVVDFQRRDFNLSEAAEQQVREGLNAMLSLYTTTLGLDVRGDISVKLSLIESKEEFDRWLTARTGEPPGRSGKRRLRYRHKRSRGMELGQRRSGSANHFARIQPRYSGPAGAACAPSWIHEGMAQYVQMLQKT